MPMDVPFWLGALLLGLAVGSFLNVVIHRLPRMLEAQWSQDAQAHVDSLQPCATPDQPAAPGAEPRYNIAVPGSHCPHCGHVLAWTENIPLLSYLVLKGRCRQCHAPIGWRYPAVEVLTASLFVWSFAQHGLNVNALAWAGFAAALVALAAIDADTRLLPDAITQPLVWSGLLAASLGWSGIGLDSALWGAVVGYGCLWSVYWLFKLVTGKEGMGHGDFKLLAGLGAWLGWPALLSLVLIASLTGLACGLWLRWRQRMALDAPMPFGPFLVLAGLWVMVWGPPPGLQI